MEGVSVSWRTVKNLYMYVYIYIFILYIYIYIYTPPPKNPVLHTLTRHFFSHTNLDTPGHTYQAALFSHTHLGTFFQGLGMVKRLLVH